MSSIHIRLLVAATIVLAGFLGITGWALEAAFRESSKTALQEKLQSHVYGLLAAADVDTQGKMQLPEHLPEPRFSRTDSGLYAFVTMQQGRLFWRSPSSLGMLIPHLPTLAVGQTRFQRMDGLFVFSHAVEWEDDRGSAEAFVFHVVEQAQAFDQQVQQFRYSLWLWLVGLAVVLLLAQAMILRWGLGPLREVEKDLEAVKEGRAQGMRTSYPRELQGLTSSLNALMEHTARVQERYRNSLDDLVHSLKTPLAYLGSVLEDQDTSCAHLKDVAGEQLQRMDHIVQHQLRRAAVAARTTLVEPVLVAPVVERLLSTLEKIYAGKHLSVERSLAEDIVYSGDEADLMEVLGNLLENAFKYAKRGVSVSVRAEHGLEILIEDDGPGIPSSQWERLLQRGKRADESVAGQGIGLAVANEIVTLYGGELQAGTSSLGGLKLRISFPA
ncbi:ATP-binding protein [Thiolapillus sp.]